MFRERHGVGCCLEDSCDHSGGTGVLLIMVLKETRVYMRDGEKRWMEGYISMEEYSGGYKMSPTERTIEH